MKKVLVIKSSIFSNQGQSSKLVDHTVSSLKQRFGDIELIERDLSVMPIEHLTAQTVTAFMAEDSADLSIEQQQEVELSNTLINELKSVDYIVLGVPMYNFTIPSTLKSWIDYVLRAGLTFNYTDTGPVGMVNNVKQVTIATTRGGLYQGTPKDTQTNYLIDTLNFIGIDNIDFAYAEELAIKDVDEMLRQSFKKIDSFIEVI